ncbi:Electron transfer flavoprotein alpha-subunit [Saguinus oedipus]|uniref:Eukaryotic peptide chain release factor subunit 1 n=1 Tax=Saguinus oedipus TaxID=9490 RepID=A0ABQ9W5H5_SAGOE|nr:Electron transfer flavoprotein alpha-subunit [Saguinus oedipus]
MDSVNLGCVYGVDKLAIVIADILTSPSSEGRLTLGILLEGEGVLRLRCKDLEENSVRAVRCLILKLPLDSGQSSLKTLERLISSSRHGISPSRTPHLKALPWTDSLPNSSLNGTSMISLIIPPKDQISRVAKMLADEFGTASNIKSRVNRLSVLGAITSVQQRLKLYNKGKNLYSEIRTDICRQFTMGDFCLLDGKSALTALLSDDSKFGFIVIDGSGALFGTLQGNTREVLHKFTVDLPKKHGRGGQSALRFARLRMEKRHNYVRKVAETAVQLFISGDKVNVAGLVLAGSADFKTELSQSDMFDQRLQSKVLKLVDISYGGENGFNQAIELSTEVLSNVKFIQEKKLIGRYFDEISQDTGKYCFGVEDTLKALEMGAVEILIVYENLDIMRYVLHCQGTEEEKILYLTPEQEKDKSHFTDKETGQEHELIESMPLLEWFANNYKKFGATLEIVTDKSQEGSQFVKGFGGIGGILRYRVDFQGMEYQGGDDEFFDLDDY